MWSGKQLEGSPVEVTYNASMASSFWGTLFKKCSLTYIYKLKKEKNYWI